MNLYADRLNFIGLDDVKGKVVERMVVVDARSVDRIAEFAQMLDLSSIDVEIFDHHPNAGQDIKDGNIHECLFGSNATQLCLRLAEQSEAIDAEDATIALTGIYADTGNFTHENVTPEDFRAASFFTESGASLNLGAYVFDATVMTADDSLNAFVYKQNPDFHADATVQLGSAVYIWLTTDTLMLPSDNMNVDTVAYNDAEPGTKPDLAFFK